MKLSPIDVAFFWSKVRIENRSRCWVWTGATLGVGYGSYRINSVGKTYAAHRVAWRLLRGSFHGKHVLHTCDNRKCVNPGHLFLGSNYDNIQDKVLKGRQARLPGEKHPSASLKEVDVAEIKNMAKAGQAHKSIAKKFSVSRSHISKIIKGDACKHLDYA